MMDFVHLDDMFVMFRIACCAYDRQNPSRIKRPWPGNVLLRRVFNSTGFGVGLPYWKSGETDEQICDQAFDAGNVLNGTDRSTAAHDGACRGRRQSGAPG